MTHLVDNLTNNFKVYYKNIRKKRNTRNEIVEDQLIEKVVAIEKTYDSCCREAQWFDELRKLVEVDQKYSKVNEIFRNINAEEGSSITQDNRLTEIYANNTEDTNIFIEENDRVLISCVLSKLSYLNDKETILQYLHSQISVTHVLEKIRKLYYFKPIHTRTKVLIAFDDQNNCYCSFNGTVNSSDLILDISCGFLEKIKFNCDDGVKHSLYSDCDRFEWAVSIVDDLISLTKKLGKKSLIFSGHSMGATFATFACFEAIKLKNKLDSTNTLELKCYSFGSPSFLHSSCKLFLDSNPVYNQVFENYLNEYDIVPMMSHYPVIFIDFIGLLSKYTRVFNHKSGRFIFYESLDTDAEFNFRSIINHVKKLYNYKKFLMIDDHKMDRYLKHLYSCYQNSNSKGSNPLNLLKSEDIV
ncbi:hypothetical protein DICPUDRAFT_148470 [Dictyostelium purpureum]|uniref:Fungal lipase-type domain-containing protein n=1 Tax=Dictyostelium purpureum TaxID=5786 RepID=F0ZB75_DICPU|nr:uncharacterized protein DICPUDRAFT_148470 [Dictyostelium purpureum]EGC38793.1 hypothetical protein DICPUDRAFT_148470 [Dictyostelium purpureum]|eukprot:XP_003284687.1 hypothetical protein DICPUDRAFT_148470 [Dictyostelium purpureum]